MERIETLRMVLPVFILLVGSFISYIFGKLSSRSGWHTSMMAGGMAVIVIICASIPVLSLHNKVSISDILEMEGTSARLFKGIPLNQAATDYAIRFTYDNLSDFLAILALALGLLVTVFSIRYMEADTGTEMFFPLLLIMITGMLGIAIAYDLFTLWVFFEMMCIASYVLVAFRKDKWEPVEAGIKYIVMSGAGSMMVVLAISIIFFHLGTLSFDSVMTAIQSEHIPTSTLIPLAVLLVIGFGVKSAIVPLHTWLPDAHAAAPSGISAMLSGIVIETGFVAMLKSLLLLTQPSVGLVMIVLALLTMTLGNVVALVQTDLKRMLAYSSIAQMGYILLGFGTFLFYTGSATGLVGGLFHIMTHAFMKGLAFLCAGMILYRIHTRKLEDMRGLAQVMPVTAICFAIAALSLAGVPPFSGFMSKWMIYKAGLDMGNAFGLGLFCTVIAILNSVISLGYYLPAINLFFSRNLSSRLKNVQEAPASMLLPVLVLAFLTVLLGIFPNFGLNLVTPAAAEISNFLANTI